MSIITFLFIWNFKITLVIMMFSAIGFEDKFVAEVDGPDSLMQGPSHLASMINKGFSFLYT